ncbi:hypothetical protein ACQEVY_19880 [Streptomyces sp. CA-288835]|uniref:hypothetical protein n=1 Tax=Streptomyces sp. CA-288835 TaxID=3240069 RepID=UPI003D8F48E2
MSTVRWEEVKRRVHEQQRAAGIPVRSPEEKRADMDRLLAEVRAYKTAGRPTRLPFMCTLQGTEGFGLL